MQALMFSIYCIGIRSITTEECRSVFGSSKDQLLIEYQSGCRQALWASKFLQSDNRDCLTALFLYLLSLGRSTTPPSLHSMLGVAVRTAQRMGMHSETMLAKHTILEAEMRRRLWWAIVLFDTRISELASSNIVTLDPTWDCRRPLNVNNSELRAEMKTPLSMRGGSSEALFIAVRSEVADFIRHSDFHLDYTNPALKLISKHTQREVIAPNHDLNKLEEMLEEKYFQFCDLENPLHFTTIWTMRAYLAKYRLLEHHARQSDLPAHRTDAQREIATSYALKVLECDTKIMTSPPTRGLRWLNMFHFPFPAYIQLLQGLARRPIDETACQAWEAISANYEGWFSADGDFDSPVYRMFSKFVLEAWEACEAASGQLKSALTPPQIVSFIRGALARAEQDVADKDNDMAKIGTGIHNRSISAPVSTKSTSQGISGTTELQCDLPTMGAEVFFGNPGQHVLATELNQLDWSGLGEWPSWGLF
ncbi:hypothetical protein LTR05_007743 [Lithohypha guttulata]|uniref:Xylanolytic transcriptional activator regulatory domain-containing protein n=1 Tax=Lithohypha guttulata TaxID=1690604 RepID=A0AAN7YDF2_9EURO|nr:hypothetical protein LTR05_007743 [Lithohypha guttulata]